MCKCTLIAYFSAFFVRCAQNLHLQTLQTLCTLLILYKIKTTTKCAISLHIVRKSRHAFSLHLVCILRVFTKCLHCLRKACICFHKLITKCAAPRRSRCCIGMKYNYSALCVHEVCKKSAKHRIGLHEVCTAGINKKESLHKVCTKAVFTSFKVCKTSKKMCIYSAKCTLCRLMHTFEKVCMRLPPNVCYDIAYDVVALYRMF